MKVSVDDSGHVGVIGICVHPPTVFKHDTVHTRSSMKAVHSAPPTCYYMPSCGSARFKAEDCTGDIPDFASIGNFQFTPELQLK